MQQVFISDPDPQVDHVMDPKQDKVPESNDQTEVNAVDTTVWKQLDESGVQRIKKLVDLVNMQKPQAKNLRAFISNDGGHCCN